MIYIDSFKFASEDEEADFFFGQRRTCYDTYYPFQVFPQKDFRQIDFSDITILYGGNGSGKSTALNLIANKIEAEHDTVYNRSSFFEDYLDLCEIEFEDESFANKVILTSDGVFDCMLDIRHSNQRIDVDRERAFDEYMHWKMIQTYPERFSKDQKEEYEEIKRHPLANHALYTQTRMANTKTQSQYVRRTVSDNVKEMSNGESAFEYFVHRIDRDGIYILDEPENSMSPKMQLELVKFLQDSARYFNCQFIIATHSPFILSIANAKIYDLDQRPVDLRKWTELENVRAYYDLFKQHEEEFENSEQPSRSLAQKRKNSKDGQNRRALRMWLDEFDIDPDVKADIFFILKTEKMVSDFIDYIASNIPVGLDKEQLEDQLLIAAEKM